MTNESKALYQAELVDALTALEKSMDAVRTLTILLATVGGENFSGRLATHDRAVKLDRQVARFVAATRTTFIDYPG